MLTDSLEINNLLNIENLNDTSLKTGFYYCMGGAVGAPFSSAWTVHVMRKLVEDGDLVITQVAYRYRDNEIWIRNYNSLSPAGWKEWSSIVQDSGWTTASLKSTFTSYNNKSENLPRYRKVGKTVEIQGVITPNSDLIENTEYTIFNLPTGYRPSRDINKLCQGTTTRIWLLSIYTNGDVSLSRYREGGSWVPPYQGNWFPFHETFLID